MANNRITWQNVAAPSFKDSIDAQALVGDLLGSAGLTLGDVAAGIDQRQKDALSNQAIAEALKYQDPTAWQAALANGGISGLGLDPARLNADAMKFFQGRTADLLNNQNTVAQTANTQAETAWRQTQDQQAQFNLGKDRLAQERNDLKLAAADEANAFRAKNVALTSAEMRMAVDALNLTDPIKRAAYDEMLSSHASYISNQTTNALNEKNATIAAEQSAFSKTISEWIAKSAREGTATETDLKNQILEDRSLAGWQQEIALKELANSSKLFEVDPLIRDQVSRTPEVISANNRLLQYQTELTMRGANPIMQAVGNMSKYTTSGDLENNTKSFLNDIFDVKNLNEEEKSIFAENAGSLTKTINKLVADHPNIPEAFIYSLAKRSLDGTGILGIGTGNITISDSVEKELAKLDQSGELTNLINQYTQHKAQTDTLAAFQRQVNQKTADYSFALDRATTDKQRQAVTKKYNDIFKELDAAAYEALATPDQKAKDQLSANAAAAIKAQQAAEAAAPVTTAPIGLPPSQPKPAPLNMNGALYQAQALRNAQLAAAADPAKNLAQGYAESKQRISHVPPMPSIFSPKARQDWIDKYGKTHHSDGRPKR